jgi:FAD/FMN-containing dehydrogenase
LNRRDFLKAVLATSGVISLWPAGCARQSTAPKETPLSKPEGILVNDVHTELNPTLVDRIVYPTSPETIAEAIISASREDKVVCVAGAKHAMGAQQFATGGILIDTTALGRVLAFDPEEGTVEVEAGIQ